MKKFKIAFWVIIFAFLALVGYQNQPYLQAPMSLRLNLGFTAYQTPEQPTWVFYISLFLIGIILTYLFSLPAKFRAGKNMRALNATIASQRNELNALKNDVAAMRSPAPVEPAQGEPAPVDTDKVE